MTADSEEADEAEASHIVHKETVTVPTTMATTISTKGTASEKWVGDIASEPRTPKVKASRYSGADACEKDCSCQHNDKHSSGCVGTSSRRQSQPPEARHPIRWFKNKAERVKSNANSFQQCPRLRWLQILVWVLPKKRNVVDR